MSDVSPSPTVSVGILLDRDQNILISRRRDDVPLPGLWEFPGGKIEENETPYDALCRELHEEIGIIIESAEFFVNHGLLSVWRVIAWQHEPYGAEGQEVRWVTIEALKNYEFPPTNQQIIQLLLQPLIFC